MLHEEIKFQLSSSKRMVGALWRIRVRKLFVFVEFLFVRKDEIYLY